MGKKENPDKKKVEREAKARKETEKKYDKQTKIAIIVMVVLILSIFIAHWIVQEMNKFKYNNLQFYKEKEGSILFYKSRLGFVTSGGQNIPFILKLRNDPRVLDEIQIDGEIALKEDVTLAVSPEIGECEDTYITLIDFSRTLKSFGINAEAATTDRKYAEEMNAKFASCKDAKGKTVIIMREGNETRITQDREPYEEMTIGKGGATTTTKYLECYIIEINNCQVQESFERFILKFIENSYSQ